MSEIPETLTRSEAARKLLALGMPLKVVTHVLDHPDELLGPTRPAVNVPGVKEAVAIVAAYQRHLDAALVAHPEPLTPGERRAFLAGVSAADEDREFDEPTPTLDVCEALRAASVLLNHASKDMIVAGLAEDGVSVTEANMAILNVLAKLSRKDSAS